MAQISLEIPDELLQQLAQEGKMPAEVLHLNFAFTLNGL